MKSNRSIVPYKEAARDVQQSVGDFRFSDDVLAGIAELPMAQRAVVPVLVMSINPKHTLKSVPGAPSFSTVKQWLEMDEHFNSVVLAAWNEWNSHLMTVGSGLAACLARSFAPEMIMTLVDVARGDVYRNPDSTERLRVSASERIRAATTVLDFAAMSTAAETADVNRARDALQRMSPTDQRALIGALAKNL